VTDDASVWLHLHTEPLVAASELVQAAVLVVFDVVQQFLETAVPAGTVRHTCVLHVTATILVNE